MFLTLTLLLVQHLYNIFHKQESIILVFDVVKGIVKYELQYKKQGAAWDFEATTDETRSMTRNVFGGAHDRAKATLTKLDPATSYTLRLCCVHNEFGVGLPGPELNVDTDPPSCMKVLFGGDKKKKKKKQVEKKKKKTPKAPKSLIPSGSEDQDSDVGV